MEKLRGAKEWDGDKVAWMKAGIRVLILDTRLCVLALISKHF